MKLWVTAVMITAVALLGCGGEDGESSEDAAAEERVEREFIAGCQDGGASQSLCRCTYDELLAAGLTPEEIQAGGSRIKGGGQIPAALIDAARVCRQEAGS